MPNRLNNKITYGRSLLICGLVFSVYFIIMATPFLLNGVQFDPNNEIFLSFYAIDFKLGFVNRVLIGGLISLFSDKWTSAQLVSMFFINLILLIAICVPLAAKVFQKGRNENLPALEYAAILFLVSPFTVSEYFIYWGGYDIFWLFGVMLCLLFVKKKYLRWFIPALCFLAIFNHYGFVLAYLPVVFAVLIYELVKADTKREKNIYRTLTVVTVLVSFVSFIYFVFIANDYIKMNLNELTEYIVKRTGRRLDMRYHSTNYYNFYPETNLRHGGTGVLTDNPLVALWRMFYYFWLVNIDLGYFINLALCGAPLAVAFGLCWRKIAKNESDKRLKRVYILFILIQCATLPFIFTSTDPQRWFSHPLFCQFILLYWISRRDPSVLHRLDYQNKRNQLIVKGSYWVYFCISFLFYIIYNFYFFYGYYSTYGLSFFWKNII